MQSIKSNSFNYLFTLELEKTGSRRLNGKVIQKTFSIPKEQINKIFLDQYYFGHSQKTNLNYLDYLVEGYKERISDLVHIELLKRPKRSDLIYLHNKFEKWLATAEIEVKEINI